MKLNVIARSEVKAPLRSRDEAIPKSKGLLQDAFALFSCVLRNDVLTVVIIFLISLLPQKSFAQQNPPPPDIEDKQQETLEKLPSKTTRHLDYDNVIDLANMLHRHPINLNKASKQDFRH
jgi:hypothetical protein